MGEASKKRVFVGWSGPRSRVVAEALVRLLGQVFRETAVEPWWDDLVPPGGQAVQEIRKSLGVASYGIICMTEENRNNLWPIFELGAVSGNQNAPEVVPLAIGNLAIRGGPIRDVGFRAVHPDRDGIRRIVEGIAAMAGVGEAECDVVAGIADAWPAFEDALRRASRKAALAPICLPGIHDDAWAIEASEMPSLRWLRNHILERTSQAVGELLAYSKGWEQYSRCVEEHIRDRDTGMYVALCGSKPPAAKRAYYRMFFEFAERRIRRDPSAVTVCRAFVYGGAPEREYEDELAWHRQEAKNGVRAVTASREDLKEIEEDFPELSQRLEDGFGMVAYIGGPGPWAAVHESVEHKSTFVEMRRPAGIRELLHLFKRVLQHSDQALGRGPREGALSAAELVDLTGACSRL